MRASSSANDIGYSFKERVSKKQAHRIPSLGNATTKAHLGSHFGLYAVFSVVMEEAIDFSMIFNPLTPFVNFGWECKLRSKNGEESYPKALNLIVPPALGIMAAHPRCVDLIIIAKSPIISFL